MKALFSMGSTMAAEEEYGLDLWCRRVPCCVVGPKQLKGNNTSEYTDEIEPF